MHGCKVKSALISKQVVNMVATVLYMVRETIEEGKMNQECVCVHNCLERIWLHRPMNAGP
jgi:hypothetical protein